MNPIELLQDFVSAFGPPGQEDQVREVLTKHLQRIGILYREDVKGNIIVVLGDPEQAKKLVVTAHLDEIAMITTRVHDDGSLSVGALGGLYAWKLGEGAVNILGDEETLNGVLSFGSIHTDSPKSPIAHARDKAIRWEDARILTGRTASELEEMGVRPGTRVVVSKERRKLFPVGNLISGHFLDDRADLVSWILAIEALKDQSVSCTFLASAAEEVGGEGALYFFQQNPTEFCIALELGANVPDAPLKISANPTLWVNDSYAAMQPRDIALIAKTGRELGLDIQYQALSRGGSDASSAASHGLVARPITLGLPMENSHGYELIHPDSMAALAELTVALVKKLQ